MGEKSHRRKRSAVAAADVMRRAGVKIYIVEVG